MPHPISRGKNSLSSYQVLWGRKIFVMAPPTPTNLAMYHAWILSDGANGHEFPANLVGALIVCIQTGQSMAIPSGWIHAVFTPEVSI